MTDNTRRPKRGGLQTKALAGLVAIMLAAAIVALVFVTNGSGSKPARAAAGQVSDVGRASSAPKTTPTPTASSAAAPTSSAPSTESSTPTASANPVKPTKTVTKSSTASTMSVSRKPITYTVKRGDNLTVIAAWFHQHGYGRLYDLNRSVIGNDPNLIFPGEKITIANGKLTTH